jgi:uncharacterized protein (TIGR02246 family)
MADNASLEAQLTTLERQSWAAWKARDGQFFASFLADDHVEVGASGLADKRAIVAFVGSPACAVNSYTIGDFRLTRISGDAAVLVYRAQQDTKCGGVPVPSPAWVSSVFVHRDGRWQNVLYQRTPATP